MSKPYLFTMTLVLLGLVRSSDGRADGLIRELPEDGHWARYRIDSKITVPAGKPAPIDNHPKSLKVAVVGTTKVDGVPCRWIEIGVQRKGDKALETELFKLLIPEEHLEPGKLPLSHIVKAWRRPRGPNVPGPVQIEAPKQDMNLQNNRMYLHGLIDGIKAIGGITAKNEMTQNLDATVVDCGLGKVKCEGVKRTVVLSSDKATLDVTETIYFHRDAPFGVVQARTNGTTKQDGNVADTRDLTLTLTKHGRNGKTALPDAN